MVPVRNFVLLMLLSLWTGVSAFANTVENRAFNAAAEAYRGGFYERAERELGEFTSKFPNSSRYAEALLLQAQARMEMTNYAGATELLTTHQEVPAALADQFAFWLAEVAFRKGEIEKAADLFASFVERYPQSNRLLEATVNEAAARSQLGQYDRVVSVFTRNNAAVRTALASSSTDPLVVRGVLLLSEAYVEIGKPQEAIGTIAPISTNAVQPVLAYKREVILCRSKMAMGDLGEALKSVTNLVQLSANPAAPPQAASESTSLHGILLERSSRPAEALAVYEKNLNPKSSDKYQREAVLKVAELALLLGKAAEGIQALERFTALGPASGVMDALLLTSAELRLRDFVTRGQGAPPATLEQAITGLTKFKQQFSGSPLIGRAELSLGWCYWLQNKPKEGNEAFTLAAASLPQSMDQAVALFKAGDTSLQLKEYKSALGHFEKVVALYGENTSARTNFIERALYQSIRAAIPLGDRASASKALGQMLQWYPGGVLAQRAVLLGGVEVSRYDQQEARTIFLDFLKAFPDAELVPEVELALARTMEQGGDWAGAIQQYDRWVVVHTNHPALVRAEYSRAWAHAKTDPTNAFPLFTNFVAKFPSSEWTPLAQWWVGDAYLQSGQFENAERAYKLIFQSSNMPTSELSYQARMMAGRAAYARQSGQQAAEYFTGLWNDKNCPADLRAQALFAYGDSLMSMDLVGTNRAANYEEAIRVFSRITEMFPTNKIGILALGQKANCLLQWAVLSKQYDAASNAFHTVATSTYSDVRARSIAKVGLAVVLEKQSEQTTPPSRELLKMALNHCLDVFYGSTSVLKAGETADPFWVRRAGMEGARLAEAQGQWSEAIRIYQRLQELIPVMRPKLERSVAKAQEQLKGKT